MLTKQEIFTTVARHLLAQGERAVSYEGSGGEVCRYRGEDGTKCAVGCLIPDEQYNKQIEGLTIHTLRTLGPYGRRASTLGRTLYASGIPVDDEDIIIMLSDLQQLHDKTYSPTLWSSQLRDLAKRHGVEYVK